MIISEPEDEGHLETKTFKRVTYQIEISHDMLGELIELMRVWERGIGKLLPEGISRKQRQLLDELETLYMEGSR